MSVKLIKADSRRALLLKLEMNEVVSKSLFDSVDFTRYVDPDLFNLGPLTQYFLRDDEEEELFAEAAIQLPKVVAEQRLMRFSAKLSSILLVLPLIQCCFFDPSCLT